MSLVGRETKVGWVPSDWSASSLGNEVEAIIGGGTPSKDVPEYWEGDIPWASVKDFVATRLSRTEDYITAKAVKESSTNLIPAGTLITPTRMALGRVAFFYCDVAINQDLKAIFPKKSLAKEFLFYWFQLNADAIEAAGTGSTVKGIRLELLRDFGIAVPPLPEQQKIAAILTAVDDKLDVIARQIEATHTLKQGLMQTLFSRGVGTQDANGRWMPHTEFKDSELGEIPVGWKCLKLGDVLTEKPEYGANASAVPFDAHNRTRYLRITDIDEHGRLRADSVKAIPSAEAKDYMLAEGDLLIARSGNTVGKSILYKSAMGPCAFAGYLLRFRFCRKALVDFIAAYLTSDTYWAWVKASVKVGAQPNINAQQYQSMIIPIPPTDEQYQIAMILAGVNAKVELLRSRELQYQTLKRGLMQKLLTGEWRVKLDRETSHGD
ncbi:restriction endonuclease subunit S [Chitinimonas sp. PSY-7]|uniref:restriction endonuclease subunit S n=1 Tax=Chitinimonas sp. PSY-7 TaxID=3459088 RepID=UPI0040403777